MPPKAKQRMPAAKKKPGKSNQQPKRKGQAQPKRRLQAPPLSHPYLRCLMANASAPTTGIGFPDGANRPSIVVDFRQTYTITPVAGNISFALCPSLNGCFALGTGAVQGAVFPKFDTTTTLAITWTTENLSLASTPSYNVLSFAEAQSFATEGLPYGPYRATAYRALMNTADVFFSGTNNANGGVVSISRTNVTTTLMADQLVNTVLCRNRKSSALGANPTSNVGTTVLPARAGYSVKNVNPRPTYVTPWEDTVTYGTPGNLRLYGQSSTGAIVSAMPWSGFDENCPVTVCNYTGLDATASVTVEVKSCIELVPEQGTMTAFAKPSPIANTTTWQQVANYARSLPTSYIAGAVGKAALGYAAGGLPGMLTAMTI